MNTPRFISIFAVSASLLLLSGCVTDPDAQTMNRSQPGPAVGNALGAATGAVASNVVAIPVGAVEGAVAATKSTFNNERRVVRTWREEKTADGRTIKVPVEIEVDANGRPIETTK